MKKKILIGSLLVLTLLLLMPSIPAIQQKIAEEVRYQELTEIFDDFGLEDIKEIMGKSALPKHPILLSFVFLIYLMRLGRSIIGLALSTNFLRYYEPLEIYHPLLFLYSGWLFISGFFWLYIWMLIANILGWNWPFVPVSI